MLFQGKKIHFVGIKGIGMSALAQLFHHQGAVVSGSDTDEVFPTDKNLLKLGIKPLLFSEGNIRPDFDYVIYSTAYSSSHSEIQKAKKLGIPLLDYSQALAKLFNTKTGLVVAGTHGKTTSSAMLARAFEDAGYDPSAVVGGELLDWQNNARYGQGDYFIAEGDEYQGKFLTLKPHGLLLTNIEYDHPDFFSTPKEYQEVFRKLIKNLDPQGVCAVNAENKAAVEAVKEFGGKTIFFSPSLQPEIYENLHLKILGEHNQLNALGVFTLASHYGIKADTILKSLNSFRGVRRRLEILSRSLDNVLIVDDYAHHPTEIRSSLKALKKSFPNRNIIAAFQPHTYTRTAALLQEFSQSFNEADYICILDIYGSAREKEKLIHSSELVEAIKKQDCRVAYTPKFQDVRVFLENLLSSTQDNQQYVFAAMGAGDIWQLARGLAKDYGK